MIDPQMIIQRSSDILASEVEGEIVMMSIEQGKYFGLDVVGGDIWKMIEAPQSIQEICNELKQEYKVEAEVMEKDVLLFVQDLIENGIVEIVPE